MTCILVSVDSTGLQVAGGGGKFLQESPVPSLRPNGSRNSCLQRAWPMVVDGI